MSLSLSEMDLSKLSPEARKEIDKHLWYLRPFEQWLPATAPASWVWNWPHQKYLYKILEKVTNGECKRLIISMPPRHCKTETVTVRYPMYRLFRDNTTRICIACYNADQANKYSRKALAIARTLNIPLSSTRCSAEEWETASGGGVMARGSVSGGVTGNGFDVILIDDPIKSRQEAESITYRNSCWEWYKDDLHTRLEPGASIIIIQTRWHEDDLVGRILASDDAPNWAVVNLPALAEKDDPLGRPIGMPLCPDRFDLEALHDQLVSLKSYGFNALYQGHPSPPSGNIFKRSWWRFWYKKNGAIPKPVSVLTDDGTYVDCEQMPLPDKRSAGVQSWDCTFKDKTTSDFVVGQSFDRVGADIFLMEQVRERMGFVATQQAVIDLAKRHPHVNTRLIEDKANGSAIIETLQHQLSVLAVNPAGGKIARASAVSPMVEAGNVYLPHPTIAPWVDAFVDSFAAFPNGLFDDEEDCFSQACLRMQQTNYSGLFKPEGVMTEEQEWDLTIKRLTNRGTDDE
jgi:predicted phage terminase large subunit-like protein